MSPTRTAAERDAVTIEIMYALVTGALLGGVGFLVTASPVLGGLLPRSWEAPWVTVCACLGAVLCAARLLQVLRWRPARNQPSQPGRTSPDS